MLKDFEIIGALIGNQVRMTLRIKVALFFSIVMPLLMFFVYTFIFGKGNAQIALGLMGPILVFTVSSSAIYGIGMQLVAMREQGTLRPYQMTPVGPVHLLASRLVTNYLFLTFTVFIQFLLAYFIFDIRPHSIPSLFAVYTIGALSICCIGLFIASLVNSAQEANIANQLTFFAILFISGITVPFTSLPRTLQRISLFMPSTHLNLMIKSILQNETFGWPQAFALCSMLTSGLFFFWVAVALFRWDQHSKITPRARNIALLSVLPYILCGVVVNFLKY